MHKDKSADKLLTMLPAVPSPVPPYIPSTSEEPSDGLGVGKSSLQSTSPSSSATLPTPTYEIVPRSLASDKGLLHPFFLPPTPTSSEAESKDPKSVTEPLNSTSPPTSSTLSPPSTEPKDLENGKECERSSHSDETDVVDWYPKSEYPRDGGVQGWTCVLGSFFALVCTFGWLNS